MTKKDIVVAYDMDQGFSLKHRFLFLSVVYGIMCLLPACLGVLMSLAAQPGGITQTNAFLAPFLGPWSQTLPPNPHPASTWSANYVAFARFLAVVLVFSVAGSYLAGGRFLRYASTVIAVLALVVWVLAGLMKAVSQLG
jgi:hypothetical protein